jgi:hypothetical protein
MGFGNIRYCENVPCGDVLRAAFFHRIMFIIRSKRFCYHYKDQKPLIHDVNPSQHSASRFDDALLAQRQVLLMVTGITEL